MEAAMSIKPINEPGAQEKDKRPQIKSRRLSNGRRISLPGGNLTLRSKSVTGNT
jgi:hypothetical protein